MKLLLFSFLTFFPLMTLGEVDDKSWIFQTASACLGTTNCSIVKTSKAYCVVQRDDSVGYVVISLNENARKRIIGYAEGCAWEEGKMPSALTGWLEHMDSLYMVTGNSNCNEAEQRENDTIQRKTIRPLLTCKWHQNSPYNDLAPVISDGNVKTVAGCVAIAAAQIAYYWRNDNPEFTLKDTPTYPYGAAPVTMSIPKGSPNNWELMKDSYSTNDDSESRYAAAQLCYVLGTTSYLNYASSTGGSINDASNALYSQYQLLSDYISKTKHTQDEWEDLIYQEIDNGRPVICAGQGDGGHAFVLDGYDSANGLYHFNFGWGGAGDGYYPIDDSEMAMGGYYRSQAIVYNIHPKYRNIEATLSFMASEQTTTIDIGIDITNNSTLDIKCLMLYIVPDGKTLNESEVPVWLYEDTLKRDGVTHQIIAHNIPLLPEQRYTLYLTDENKYIILQQQVHLESGIDNLDVVDKVRQPVFYNMRGQKVENIVKGVYIIDSGKNRKKIIGVR